MNKKYFEELKQDIKNAYEYSPSLSEAEKLAAKFLHAQMLVAEELQLVDLDTRMKKNGLKAVRAAVYMDACSKGEKKPTEAALAAIVDLDKVVQDEQDKFDDTAVRSEALTNYLGIFKDAHIYFRGIAKGNFTG